MKKSHTFEHLSRVFFAVGASVLPLILLAAAIVMIKRLATNVLVYIYRHNWTGVRVGGEAKRRRKLFMSTIF